MCDRSLPSKVDNVYYLELRVGQTYHPVRGDGLAKEGEEPTYYSEEGRKHIEEEMIGFEKGDYRWRSRNDRPEIVREILELV